MHPNSASPSDDASAAPPPDTSAHPSSEPIAAGIDAVPDALASIVSTAPADPVLANEGSTPAADELRRLRDGRAESGAERGAADLPLSSTGIATTEVDADPTGRDDDPAQPAPTGAAASEPDQPTLEAALPAAQAPPDLSPAACAARLAALFPAVFTAGAFRPLKLRIQADIQQRAPATFSRKVLSIFLHRHTTSTGYLKALVAQPQRVDLDGNPAGDIADEHRQAASAELERRRGLHEARRAAEREAQRSANEEARRQRAAGEESRRERAGLLRAFEGSTLTPTNFCALKGIAPDALEALLAQARQERQQPVAEPERPDDRGHGRPAPRTGRRDDAPRRPAPGRKPGR